jgi:hypothetical protein
VARFAGTEDYADSGVFSLRRTGGGILYEPADFGLNGAQWLPAAVGLFVLAVWGSIIFALLSTVRGIRTANAGVAAVQPMMQPWQPQISHQAPPWRILIALAVLVIAVAVPASWLLGQTGGPSDETLSTPDAHFEHDGTDGGQFDPSQPIVLPEPVPLTATLVSFVETVTFDDAGQPEPGSVMMPSTSWSTPGGSMLDGAGGASRR